MPSEKTASNLWMPEGAHPTGKSQSSSSVRPSSQREIWKLSLRSCWPRRWRRRRKAKRFRAQTGQLLPDCRGVCRQLALPGAHRSGWLRYERSRLAFCRLQRCASAWPPRPGRRPTWRRVLPPARPAAVSFCQRFHLKLLSWFEMCAGNPCTSMANSIRLEA
jgi:hypothetical protein